MQRVVTSVAGWRWMVLIAIVFGALVVPAILAGGGGTSQARDFRGYHAIEIRRIQSQWPSPDFRDSCTSTTPGLHMILGGLAASGLPAVALRLVGGIAGVLVWLVVWRFAATWTTPTRALVAMAPIGLCNYLLGSAVWTTTDALATALAAATLAVGMLGRGDRRSSLLAGTLGAGAVMVRQILLWSILPACLAVWRSGPASISGRLARLGLVLLPPCCVAAAFMVIWGGSLPPRFQAYHAAVWNPTCVTIALACFGLFGALLLPGIWIGLDRQARKGCLAIAVCAAILSALPRSDYRKVLAPEEQEASLGTTWMWEPAPPDAIRQAGEVGRWGGPLWELARVAPVVQGRSVLLVALAGVGSSVLFGLLVLADRRGRSGQALQLIAAICGMVAAQAFNAQTFQRYFDPWVLLTLGWMVAMALGGHRLQDRALLIGMIMLGGLQLSGSVAGVLMPAFTGPMLPAW